VPKYQHRFCNTGFGSLEFTPVETAIVCELLLRGPQTPGELRSRVPRMAPLQDGAEIETALENLATRPDGPFVKQLPREPGRRDSRYAHLFSGEDSFPSSDSASTTGETTPQAQPLAEPESRPNISGVDARGPLAARVQSLEDQVAALRQELEELRARINSP